MPANDNFQFFEAIHERRTFDAVLSTVDGMKPAEALYLLNSLRALDALNEATAAGEGIADSVLVMEMANELTDHIAAIALAIHEREDD